jgi:hypothetical protein
MWFTENATSMTGQITMSGVVTTFNTTTPGAGDRIAVGPSDLKAATVVHEATR